MEFHSNSTRQHGCGVSDLAVWLWVLCFTLLSFFGIVSFVERLIGLL